MMKTIMKALILSAGLSSLALPAFSDEATESYVGKNAAMALETLNDASLTGPERRLAFNELMTQFTDLDYIVLTVLDRYYRQFSEAELKEFTEAFHEYALATYEAQLDRYRGNAITVVSSKDYPKSAKTSTFSDVTTVIDLPDSQKGLTVIWRVVEFQPNSKYAEVFGTGYKVTDVGLDLDGGLLWLAQNQKQQFQAILGRNGGKADALIARVREMTEELNAEAARQRDALGATVTKTENG